MVDPLVYNAHGAFNASEVGNAVFRKDCKSQPVYHFRDSVIDFGVNVIGTTGKHNAASAGADDFFKRFLSGFLRLLAEFLLFLPCGVNCVSNLQLSQCWKMNVQFFVQAFGKPLFIINR